VAANGYDVVSYFKESAAGEGSKEIHRITGGRRLAILHRREYEELQSRAENIRHSSAVIVLYGTSQGIRRLRSQAWTIVGWQAIPELQRGVKKKWTSDRKALIDQANANWPKIRDKE